MSPKVHHCMGGMATNVATAVLDVETDQPIPANASTAFTAPSASAPAPSWTAS